MSRLLTGFPSGDVTLRGKLISVKAFCMSALSLSTIAFAAPGGESSPRSKARPIDLVHLRKQTFGDRNLEQEVLGMFLQQAQAVKERLSGSNKEERVMLAHGLRGSAGGVGAFAVADAAAAVERDPHDKGLANSLSKRIDEMRDFVASICR
jgi:HPt (histidine-containing phosphotransfer) domain-containing protein